MSFGIRELRNIMPISNIPTVLKEGILSNERVGKLQHRSVAMAEVQERRDKILVPGGLRLHQYANLYFHARNPMMFKRRAEIDGLCVLQISEAVLKLPGIVLTDQNAASGYVRFLSVKQMDSINFELVFAEDWRHPGDEIAYWKHKAAKCAEVLVPHRVAPEFIEGAYVVNKNAQSALRAFGFDYPVTLDPHLFFADVDP